MLNSGVLSFCALYASSPGQPPASEARALVAAAVTLGLQVSGARAEQAPPTPTRHLLFELLLLEDQKACGADVLDKFSFAFMMHGWTRHAHSAVWQQCVTGRPCHSAGPGHRSCFQIVHCCRKSEAVHGHHAARHKCTHLSWPAPPRARSSKSQRMAVIYF